MKFLTRNPKQTRKAGEVLAKELLIFCQKTIKERKRAFVFGLMGDLGGGKTTFLQGFARGLGVEEKVTSPTFIIMRKFKIKNQKIKVNYFYHFDCYRIKSQKEILDLGFKKIISDPKNIIAIEWVETIKKIIPKESILIKFKIINNKRKIVIELKK